eukprot:4299774-Prymnesium_polylepis.2
MQGQDVSTASNDSVLTRRHVYVKKTWPDLMMETSRWPPGPRTTTYLPTHPPKYGYVPPKYGVTTPYRGDHPISG